MGRQSKKKREVLKSKCIRWILKFWNRSVSVEFIETNLLQVEYEQLWNVEDRSSRRLSSSEEEDTEEEAPGISSSPLQVNIGRKNKITD